MTGNLMIGLAALAGALAIVLLFVVLYLQRHARGWMHEAGRSGKEYALVAEIGQAVSSRLSTDEVLQTVYRELGRLFDTSSFYVAFAKGDEILFELEVENNVVQPKRTRKSANGITEHIIQTREPLLVRNDMDALRTRLGLVQTGTPARSFMGVPIVTKERTGVMAAMNREREFVYNDRDLELMKTAAGQAAVAIENARLFEEQQDRSRTLAFLNSVSKTAISSRDAEQMLAEIVEEVRKNFQFDHFGIGILDYSSKEIEIKAEAGMTGKLAGRRIPLGVGILGRVARSSEVALLQGAAEQRLMGLMPQARSVLCLPICYSDSLLGVVNIESEKDNAFSQHDVLILRTLADLLATALHNVYVFQKMEQQSITDALTGIKTRRFFNEALQAEWKRASRNGRAFSVVLIDLDGFKQVNDTLGHLEGDLVLARIGRLLEQKSRQSNIVARYGGDEFVVLMPETGVEQAQILAERLRLWLATDPMLNDRKVTGSFGVATFPLHASNVEDLVRVADTGMYSAKRAGGNRVSTPEDMTANSGPLQHRKLIEQYLAPMLTREMGASLTVEQLLSAIRRVAEGADHDAEVLRETFRVITRAAETREMHGAGHGEAVALYAQAIARELRVSDKEMEDLVFAARVHDVGKILIDERLLNQPSSLTPEEYQQVRAHALHGAKLLEAIPNSRRLQQLVLHHHERFDGAGHPAGMKGENIPMGARILAVAEAYSNMTADRPYKPALTADEAISELETHAGTQFDGLIVRLFVRQLRGERMARAGS